jgi:glutamyl-tRNA synthetase
MRTALYAYLLAKSMGGKFFLRIEDTDRARLVEGAAEAIPATLRGAGLLFDEGPDIGGPAAPYVQSERREFYRPYAELLCERGAAYYCFCGHVDHEGRDHAEHGLVSREEDPCRALPYAQGKRRAEAEAHVVRMKAPREGTTTFHDEVFGDVTVENASLDDMVLLKSDGLPTYNFANVIDDHLMGTTHVLRGDEYISSAPKYTLLYKALGWDEPVYITVSRIMRDERHKLSKRHGDPTYEDLLGEGFLPEAIINYIALLGWSPGGERELYTLAELEEVFSVKGISKSPALFDKAKLRHFNAEYIRAKAPGDFAALAEPYIRQAVKTPDVSIPEIAAILQPRCERLADIGDMIGFIDRLPDYSAEMFVHKKSKCDKSVALDMLLEALIAFQNAPDWAEGTIRAELAGIAERHGVKNATVMWPVRVAVSGMAVTPGGAVELCRILGRYETLGRVGAAIERLSAEGTAW